jgi:hypothetical protein
LQSESALKNTLNRKEAIAKKVNDFFSAYDVRIPGAGPEDFINAITKAAQAGNIIK